MGVRRYHIERESVDTGALRKEAVTKQKISPKALQCGRTVTTFPFSAVGEETVNATIPFPKAFDAPPAVVAAIEGIDVGIVRISVTTTSFSIHIRDDKGVDYTSGQTITVDWIAVAV